MIKSIKNKEMSEIKLCITDRQYAQILKTIIPKSGGAIR